MKEILTMISMLLIGIAGILFFNDFVGIEFWSVLVMANTCTVGACLK